MSKFKTLILSLTALLCISTHAEECEMPIAIIIPEQVENIPTEAESVLRNSLTRLAGESNLITDFNFSQFIMTVKVDVIDKEILETSPAQVMYNLGVTFYIANAYTKTKFSSAFIELKGVGRNETKSMIDAMKRINGNNAKIRSMVTTGRTKILDYYDNHYGEIIAQAEQKASMQQYEEAIALTVSVPSCSKGYKSAITAGLKYYTKYRDRYYLAMLNKAKAIWAAGQNQDTALEIVDLISSIDPEAACYKEGVAFLNEVKKQVRKDIDFEEREKYHDAISLEQKRISAMRDIGVAWGKGQQPKTTNITWLR